MGWIKDIHDIIVKYLPKKIGLDVYVESIHREYRIHFTNVSGKNIFVNDVLVNGFRLNDFSPQYGEGGERYITEFSMRENQTRTIILYKIGVEEKPRIVSFVIKRKVLKPLKLDFDV
jgi:hypothetical protein